jgi:hypothetical protein
MCEVLGNIYGRVLPTDRQAVEDSRCVTCGHTHWDGLRGIYVRCGVCDCENVGRNEIPIINPDEALADILMLCAKDQAPGESLDPHEVEQLTGLIVRLNDWLARGGSLPQAWEIDVLLAEGSS